MDNSWIRDCDTSQAERHPAAPLSGTCIGFGHGSAHEAAAEAADLEVAGL